jgi:hypothetical protein
MMGKTYIKKMESVQARLVKKILGVSTTLNSAFCLEQMKVPTLRQRYIALTQKFLARCSSNSVTQTLEDYNKLPDKARRNTLLLRIHNKVLE